MFDGSQADTKRKPFSAWAVQREIHKRLEIEAMIRATYHPLAIMRKFHISAGELQTILHGMVGSAAPATARGTWREWAARMPCRLGCEFMAAMLVLLGAFGASACGCPSDTGPNIAGEFRPALMAGEDAFRQLGYKIEGGADAEAANTPIRWVSPDQIKYELCTHNERGRPGEIEACYCEGPFCNEIYVGTPGDRLVCPILHEYIHTIGISNEILKTNEHSDRFYEIFNRAVELLEQRWPEHRSEMEADARCAPVILT